MSQMPEMGQVEKNLAAYREKLGARIKSLEEWGQKKMEEYQTLKARGELNEAAQRTKENELNQIDTQLKNLHSDSETDLSQKQQDLLAPVLEKLQNAINTVARAQGYTLILNQTTSAGVSTILYGPDENDITPALLKQLGIPPPKNR